MKQYTLVKILFFSLFLFCFLIGSVLAQVICQPRGTFLQAPSIEVFPSGCFSYPSSDNVTADLAGTSVVVTAEAADISGVASVVAKVQDPANPSQYIHSEVMYDDGLNQDGAADDGVYGAIFSVSGWDDDTYYVDIVSTDILGNSGTYASAGTFTIVTATTVELWTGYSETYWGSNDAFGSNDVYGAQDPYNTYFQDSRAQFIVSASDLTGAGLSSGDTISDIYLKTNLQPGRDLANFRIKAKLTTASITTSWEGGWTTLFGPTTIDNNDTDLSTNGNWKKYTFTQSFQWNGTSNIMFDISRDDSTYAVNGGMYVRANIGTDRMFAGDCDSCTDGSGLQIPYRISGSDNGMTFTSCPDLKITFN